MAFPTIPTVAAGRVLLANQLDTTATRTFPDLSGLTKNNGDLLVAIIVAYQTSTGTDAAFSGWTGSFTEFHDTATSTTLAVGCAYKWSTGSETGTFAVTQAGTITGDASMIVMSIPGAHATTVPEAGSRASGTTTAANPAAFNPTGWDVEDTLWISVVGSGMTSATGSWTATGTAAPTDYTDRVATGAVDTSTIGDVEAAVAFRQLAAASEDVGAGGADTSNARQGAIVIAVRPAAITAVGKEVGLVWDARAAVGDPVQTLWAIRAAVGDPLEAIWNVTVPVGDPLETLWDVRAAIGDPLEALWDVRAAIGDPLEALWDTRAAVGDPVQTIWDVRAVVGDLLEALWDVAVTGGTTPVGNTIQALWDTRAAVGDPLQTIWDTRAAVGDPLQVVCDVRAVVGDPVQTIWDTRAAVGDPVQVVWDTRAAVGDPLEALWDVNGSLAAVGCELGTIWDTRAAVGDPVQVVWDTRAAVGDLLEALWTVESTSAGGMLGGIAPPTSTVIPGAVAPAQSHNLPGIIRA